mgnify:CR=1 FL=1
MYNFVQLYFTTICFNSPKLMHEPTSIESLKENVLRRENRELAIALSKRQLTYVVVRFTKPL